MVDLYFLDSDLFTLTITSGFSSLVWTEEYYSTGSFQVVVSDDLKETLEDAVYLYRADAKDFGVIERVEQYGSALKISGRMGTSLLDDWAVYSTYERNANAELWMRGLVERYCTIKQRIKVTLGAVSGVGSTINKQVTGGTVLDALRDVAIEQDLGFRLSLDYQNSLFVFTVYQGVDRRQSQNVNTWVVLSESWGNVVNERYIFDDSKYKNYAYVAGQIVDGVGRVIGLADARPYPNIPQRELFIDKRNEEKIPEESLNSYSERLAQLGLEILAAYTQTELITADYIGKKLSIGDYITYITKSGLTIDSRIGTIVEAIENAEVSYNITLGKDWILLYNRRVNWRYN